MKDFSVESKIKLLIILAVFAVCAAGYLAYNSINFVLTTIKKEAQPNYSLVVLKEVYSSLQLGESNLEYYNLTGNKRYLNSYHKVISSVDEKIDLLYIYNKGKQTREAQIDTITNLLEQKFSIWEKLILQDNENRVNEALNELSDALESATDTVTIQVPKSVKIVSADTVNVTTTDITKENQKSNIFKRLFKKKNVELVDDTIIKIDSTFVQEKIEATDTSIAMGIDKNLIRYEIVRLQQQEGETMRRLTAKEINLRQKNNLISQQLEQLISKIETEELEILKMKTKKADYLVDITNKWSMVFLITFLLLLFIVIYIIQRYTRKSQETQFALIEAKNAALRLSRTKEQFLANMSHEIRTPMNAILGFTQQILQMPIDKKPREYLSIVNKSADHLLRIINDILAFSKLEAGKIELEKQPFSLEDILNQSYDLFNPLAKQKNIELSFKNSSPASMVLMGDSFRLQQIIYNLLSNAIKFTSEGKVELLINSKTELDGIVSLNLEFTDTGIGIAEEKLNAIFEEFTQAEISTTRNYGGTGLGLAIVYKLVKLHKGSIYAQNNSNGGACFNVSIPYQISEKDFILPTEIDIEQGAQILSEFNFIVADDDDYNRKLIQHILEKWGVKYVISSNGNETLKQLKKDSFNLVLLDIHMPGMNGYEVAKTIRNKSFPINNNVPIIAVTASSDKEEITKTKAAGINSILGKPFSESELFNKIIDILEIDKSMLTYISNEKNKSAASSSIESSENEFHELYKLANNDKTFVREMLDMFVVNTSKDLIEMQSAIHKQKWESFAELTHKIKSPCKHLDEDNLSTLLKNLELKAREGKNEKLIVEMFEQAKADIETLINKIENHLEKHFS